MFDGLLETIAGSYGLKVREERSADLERAATELAARRGLLLQDLGERAGSEPELLRELAGQLTVGESCFLRHSEHFEAVLAHLSRRLAETPDGPPLTVWSAGCSRGEEPYSLAALLGERLGWAQGRVRILASDLCSAAIATARSGVYGDGSLRGVSDAFRARHFRAHPEGWEISESLRRQVQFDHLSIPEHLQRFGPGSIEVVLFRNVGLYLRSPALRKIHQGFARVLAPDGLLVLGPSDPAPARELFGLQPDAGSVYRPRRGAPARPLEPLAAPARFPDSPPAPARLSLVVPPAPARPEPARPEPAAVFAEAQRLGDTGSSQRALAAASRAIELAPARGAGYVLRGTLLLAEARHAEAVADLRRAVFLAPDDLLARFLYAQALRAAGLPSQGRAETRELLARLAARRPASLLSDGRTTVGELLAAARQFLEATA